jgi:hypothetical protein
MRIAPAAQHDAAGRAGLRIFALLIEHLCRKHWQFVDESVTTAIRVNEFARYDSGLTVIHESNDFDGEIHNIRKHGAQSSRRRSIRKRTDLTSVPR